MLLNREKLILLQIHHLSKVNLQLGLQYVTNKEHSQKLTPYLFQNNVVLYFESYWKRENEADINFWGFY